MSAPAGFVPYSRSSRYLELIGPLYESEADPSLVGLRIDERHTNARGFLHGGVLVAVADVVMGHTAQRARPTGHEPGHRLDDHRLPRFRAAGRLGSPVPRPSAASGGSSPSPRASSTHVTGSCWPPAASSPLPTTGPTMTTAADGDFRRDVADWVLSLPVAAAFGLTFTRLAAGQAEAHLAWRPEHSHAPGAFQASPIAALADFTGAAAGITLLPAGSAAATVDYTAKFLTEARGDRARRPRPGATPRSHPHRRRRRRLRRRASDPHPVCGRARHDPQHRRAGHAGRRRLT